MSNTIALERSQDTTPNSEYDLRLIDTMQILAIGLGWFFSVQGVLGLVVSGMLIVNAIQRLDYALISEPISIAADQVDAVRHYDFVKLTARLDYDDRLAVETNQGDRYTLTPVAGTDRHFLVYQKGHYTQAEVTDHPRTFTGRVAGRNWVGEWDIDGSGIDVVNQFARQDMQVLDSALVLVVGDTPKFQPWQTFVGVAGVFVLAWFAVRLRRTIGFLRDRGRLTAYLNTFGQDDCCDGA